MFGEHQREERREEHQREHLENQREAAERQREANERQHERIDRREEHMLERPHEYGDRQMNSSSSPTFHPSRPTQIILSPGIGAGWITNAPHGASDDFLAWMITYEPLVHALERGAHKDRIEEILREFHKEARTRYHMEHGIVTPRPGDLEVRNVSTPFEVSEIEGRERIECLTASEMNMSRRRVIRL